MLGPQQLVGWNVWSIYLTVPSISQQVSGQWCIPNSQMQRPAHKPSIGEKYCQTCVCVCVCTYCTACTWSTKQWTMFRLIKSAPVRDCVNKQGMGNNTVPAKIQLQVSRRVHASMNIHWTVPEVHVFQLLMQYLSLDWTAWRTLSRPLLFSCCL